MKRNACLLATLALVVFGSTESFGRLPGTMNFDNATGPNLNQVIGESPNNEKEVDWADYDNDGDLDVVVGVGYSDFGQRRNKLYRNDNGVLNEVSNSGAIPGFTQTDTTRNAFFRDLDEDGWVDVWIVNDSNNGNGDRRDRLYMNKQVGGNFSQFVDEAIARLGSPAFTGPECSAVVVDLNQDGHVDFYGGNYPNNSQDRMWMNNADNVGFFTEKTATNVPVDGHYTVDVDAADMNGDGTIDILLANWGSSGGDRIYYNNLNNAGTEMGDFTYGPGNSAGVQFVGSPPTSENGVQSGDFNGDGRMDIYLSTSADQIWQNQGNGANGHAIFSVVTNLPTYVRSNQSVKSIATDFNNDDRTDLLVTMQNSRPAILRNTSVNNVISFVDWTPGDAFPSGGIHRGWHGNMADATGDGYVDIFLGAWVNDHYFTSAESNELDQADIGGTLPALLNTDPVAVVGSTGGTQDFSFGGPGNMFVSAVLNSDSDVTLEVDGNQDFTSDRGGIGVEEAGMGRTAAGSTTVSVIVNQVIGDSDGDGDVDVSDFADMNDCSGPVTADCEVFDFDGNGVIDWADAGGFQLKHSGIDVPAEASYILEVLVRN
jgi:VCBS repeat protein